jgi:hypothetical protein
MKQAIGLGVAVLGLVGFSSRPGSAQEQAPPAAVTAPAPAEAASAVPVAPVAVEAAPEALPAGSVKLHLRANQPGVAFHYAKVARLNGDYVPQEWTRLCLEECDAVLPRGYYRLALSSGADEPVMAPTLLEATTNVRLEGAYTDHSRRRVAGWLVLGIGGVASVTNIALGAGFLSQSEERVGNATLIAGVVGMLASLAIGIPLAAWGDDSRVDLRK